jgi:hypothetical protein
MAVILRRNGGRAQRHPVMEVKDFRVGCGEFISASDVDKEEM